MFVHFLQHSNHGSSSVSPFIVLVCCCCVRQWTNAIVRQPSGPRRNRSSKIVTFTGTEEVASHCKFQNSLVVLKKGSSSSSDLMTMHERSHFLVNVARLCLAVEILLDVRFRWTFRSLGFFCLAYSSVVRLDHYFIILYLSRASCTRALLLLCAFGKAANDLPRVLDFNVVSWKSNSCAVYLK